MPSPEKLSAQDISRLLEGPPESIKAKAEIADKLAVQYKSKDFAPEQLELAEQIFRLLLKDAETYVRRALSESLKESKNIPHDIVIQLARDIDEVSLPMLEFSEVLTDDDLILIISGAEEINKQIAIAKRKNLSDKVTSSLIDKNNEEVLQNLLQNQTANINETGLSRIGENFKDNENILGALVTHSAANAQVAEKILAKVSESLREMLYLKNKEALDKAGNIFQRSQEAATMKFLGAKSSDQELARLMNYLEESGGGSSVDISNRHSPLSNMIEALELSGKLTPFTALCLGSMSLFEITIARMAKIPIYNAKKLALDESDHGLKALYDKAGLPASMYEAVKIMVSVVRGIEKEKPAIRERLQKSDYLANYMIQKIMYLSEGEEIPHINYFLGLLTLHAKMEGGK